MEELPCIWTWHGLLLYEQDMEIILPKNVAHYRNVLDGCVLGKEGIVYPLQNDVYDFTKMPNPAECNMIKYYNEEDVYIDRRKRNFAELHRRLRKMQQVYEFLKNAGVYYLATVEGDQARVRPFGTVDVFEGKLYIQTGKVKAVSKQIQANPKVEICAFDGGKWIRVTGNLVRDDRVEAKAHMLEAYPNLQSMYSATDDNTEVLYFENATATISSFTEETRVFTF